MNGSVAPVGTMRIHLELDAERRLEPAAQRDRFAEQHSDEEVEERRLELPRLLRRRGYAVPGRRLLVGHLANRDDQQDDQQYAEHRPGPHPPIHPFAGSSRPPPPR